MGRRHYILQQGREGLNVFIFCWTRELLSVLRLADMGIVIAEFFAYKVLWRFEL